MIVSVIFHFFTSIIIIIIIIIIQAYHTPNSLLDFDFPSWLILFPFDSIEKLPFRHQFLRYIFTSTAIGCIILVDDKYSVTTAFVRILPSPLSLSSWKFYMPSYLSPLKFGIKSGQEMSVIVTSSFLLEVFPLRITSSPRLHHILRLICIVNGIGRIWFY